MLEVGLGMKDCIASGERAHEPQINVATALQAAVHLHEDLLYAQPM